MKIIILQSNEPDNGKISANEIHSALSNINCKGGMLVLPEAFDTGWNVGDFRDFGNGAIPLMRELSHTYGMSVCGSTYVDLGGSIRNRFFVATEDGQEFFCDKRHLFGDFERKEVTKGDTVLTFPIHDLVFRAVVCYDLRFPVWCRNSQNAPYDVLLCVSQWPESRIIDRTALLAARAMENVAYVVNSNGLGGSMIFGPDGLMQAKIDNGISWVECEIDSSKLIQYRSHRKYLADSDNFSISM